MTAAIRNSAVAGVLLVSATGCYTTSHTVTVSTLRTQHPVSASGQYVQADGRIVTEEDYEVVQPFEIERRIEGPRHETTEASLVLDAEIDRAVGQAGGDAATDVSIFASEYDSGSHGSAAGWKIMGWTFGLTGLTFLGVGAAVDDDISGTFYVVGGVMAGVGVISYLLSSVANDPATWDLHVKGQVVKRNAPPPPPEVATPPQEAFPVPEPPPDESSSQEAQAQEAQAQDPKAQQPSTAQ